MQPRPLPVASAGARLARRAPKGSWRPQRRQVRGQTRAPASCALRPRLWTPSCLLESCTRDSSPVPGAGRALEGRARALACWGMRAAGPARALGHGCGGAAEELSLVLTLTRGPPRRHPNARSGGPHLCESPAGFSLISTSLFLSP